MNILMITANDPAGMGIAFTNAINRYTDHRCRLITFQDRYGIDFGKDIHLPDIHDDDFGEVEALLKDADIIHFHMLSDENMHLGPLVIRDYIHGKKILHHHHGHPDYILNIDKYNEKYRLLKRKVIVSTPDLLNIANDATWVPNMVPINDPQYLPRYDDTFDPERVRICQAPTRKFHKNTEVFLRVLERIKQNHELVEKVIIERVNHMECLRIKRQCQVVFDHMRGWFGISSLESLAQGKPVIAGLDQWNLLKIRDFTQREDVPWIIARNEQELEREILRLVIDSDRRKNLGIQSRKFMEDCWSESHVIGVLMAIYNSL